MSRETINIVFKLDDIPKKDFKNILPKDLSLKDRELASDLLDHLLKWNPKERLTCDQALKHEFFRGA